MQAGPCFLSLIPRKGLGAVRSRGRQRRCVGKLQAPSPEGQNQEGPVDTLFVLGHWRASVLIRFTSK